jgi:hypothetical protein
MICNEYSATWPFFCAISDRGLIFKYLATGGNIRFIRYSLLFFQTCVEFSIQYSAFFLNSVISEFGKYNGIVSEDVFIKP